MSCSKPSPKREPVETAVAQTAAADSTLYQAQPETERASLLGDQIKHDADAVLEKEAQIRKAEEESRAKQLAEEEQKRAEEEAAAKAKAEAEAEAARKVWSQSVM